MRKGETSWTDKLAPASKALEAMGRSLDFVPGVAGNQGRDMNSARSHPLVVMEDEGGGQKPGRRPQQDPAREKTHRSRAVHRQGARAAGEGMRGYFGPGLGHSRTTPEMEMERETGRTTRTG